jgi:magnesium chelatase family protein
MLSSPSAGKSMLACRLTTILPAMTLPEALETTRIARVAGRTGERTAFVMTRTNHLRGDHTGAPSEVG